MSTVIMPQTTYYTPEGLVNASDVKALYSDQFPDSVAAMVECNIYPEVTAVYSFQAYFDIPIPFAWVPTSEAAFSRSMALAAAILWNAEFRAEYEIR